MTLGEKLQRLRRERTMSQEELAAQITVSRQAISKWELDESVPDIANVVQLSQVFGVSTDYLLLDDAAPQPAQPVPAQREKQEGTAKVLYVGSVFFVVIGVLVGFAGWNDVQTMEAVIGAMIVQAVGVAAYFIGRMLFGTAPPLAVDFINLSAALFMPISLAVTSVGDRAAPYPTTPFHAAAFWAVYLLALGSAYLILRNRHRGRQ